MNDALLERITNTLERIDARLEASEASRYTCSHPGCKAKKSSQWATCPSHRQKNDKQPDVFTGS